MKLSQNFRGYVLGALLLVGGAALFTLSEGWHEPATAQNAGQALLTPVGDELIQAQSQTNNTAAIAFTSIASLRDGRMWVFNAPTTGFTLTMTNLQSVVSLNPAGTLATGTVVMPPSLVDGKTVSLFSSQTITALTLSTSNSATFVPAAPTTIAANAALEFVYDKANNQWHRFQ